MMRANKWKARNEKDEAGNLIFNELYNSYPAEVECKYCGKKLMKEQSIMIYKTKDLQIEFYHKECGNEVYCLPPDIVVSHNMSGKMCGDRITKEIVLRKHPSILCTSDDVIAEKETVNDYAESTRTY